MDKSEDPQQWAVEIELDGDYYGIWLSNPYKARALYSTADWWRSSLPAAERKGNRELARLRKRLTRDNERRAELKSKGY